MKKSFQFRSQLQAGRENLAQSATFLPGQSATARSAGEIFQSELSHLPAFGALLNFNPAKNGLAQPLLKGGLQ